jgi:hypothetical protein
LLGCRDIHKNCAISGSVTVSGGNEALFGRHRQKNLHSNEQALEVQKKPKLVVESKELTMNVSHHACRMDLAFSCDRDYHSLANG